MSRWADPNRCPDCGGAVAGDPICPACDLQLTGPLAARLFALLSEADDVLAALPRVPQQAEATPASDSPRPPRTEPADHSLDRPRLLGVRLPSATVPLVLLALGALLVAASVLVFAGVTWFLLPPWGRGLLLAAVATAAGAAAWSATRKGLRIAAEILWPLALLAALVAAFLVGPDNGPGADLWTLLVGLTLIVSGFAGAARMRSDACPVPLTFQLSVLVSEMVAFTGLLSLEPALPLLTTGATLIVLLATSVIAAAAARADLQAVLGGNILAAATAWLVLVLGGVNAIVFGDIAPWSPSRYADLLVAAALAGGAAYAPGTSAAATWCRRLGAAAATLVVAGGAALATTSSNSASYNPDFHPNAAALIGSAALMACAVLLQTLLSDTPSASRDRREGIAWAWAVGALAAVVVVTLATVSVLGAVSAASGQPVTAPSLDTSQDLAWLWALPLVGGVALLTAQRLRHGTLAARLLTSTGTTWLLERLTVATLMLIAAAALAVAPVSPLWVTALPIGVAVALAAISLGRALVAFPPVGSDRSQDRTVGPRTFPLRDSLLLVAVTLGAGLAVTTPSRWLLVGLLALLVMLSLRRALGRPRGERLVRAAAVAAAVAAGAGSGALALALPQIGVADGPWRGVVLAYAALWAVVTAGLRHGPLRRLVSGAVALIVLAALTVGQPADTVAWLLLASGGVAVLVTLLTPDDDGPAWVGSGLFLLATIARDAAGASLPESVSLPAGGALIAVGAWQLARRPGASSLRLLAPALALALGPTLLLTLEDPLSLRALALTGLALAALGWGALGGLAAPLLAGAGSLGLLGVRLLGPVSTVVPWWLVAGTIGTALIAVGITWEARRAEVDAARRYVRSLR